MNLAHLVEVLRDLAVAGATHRMSIDSPSRPMKYSFVPVA
jgi:hypothetical protein